MRFLLMSLQHGVVGLEHNPGLVNKKLMTMTNAKSKQVITSHMFGTDSMQE